MMFSLSKILCNCLNYSFIIVIKHHIIAKASYRRKCLTGVYSSREIEVYKQHGAEASAESSHPDPQTGSRERAHTSYKVTTPNHYQQTPTCILGIKYTNAGDFYFKPLQ